jgi:hypothetical protein
MRSSSDMPPTPPPPTPLPISDEITPLLAPLPIDDVTSSTLLEHQRELADDERTRRFLSASDEVGDDPADDLGLDRPLFPRRPESDPAEEIDVARYDRLVAATRAKCPTLELRPRQVTASVTPQAVFEITPVGGQPDAEPPEEGTALRRPRIATGPGLAFDPTGQTPVIVAPPRYDAGVTTRSIASCTSRTRRRPWLLFLSVSALVGVGAGLGAVAIILHRPIPAAPLASRSALAPQRLAAPAAVTAPRGAPVAPATETVLDVARALARGRLLSETDQHQAAYEVYAQTLARAPHHLEALVGKASAAVELGRSAALDELQRTRPHRAALLRIRLSMVRGEWWRAKGHLLRLPRNLRYQPQQMAWMAEISRAVHRLEEARGIYRHVLRDPRPTSARLRAQVHLALSELLLATDPPQALAAAARARQLAAQQPSDVLRARVERQLQRCQALASSPRVR